MNPIIYEIIAIDIAKDTLEVLSDKLAFNVLNQSEGFGQLLEHLASFETPLVACEATGGYERALIEALTRKGIPFALLNPARVRAFAKSEGIKAKTDPIDARMIQRFAREKAVRPSNPADPVRQKLAELLDRRSHLTEQVAREKNRLQNSARSIHGSIAKMIKFVEKEIQCIEKRIRKLVQSDLKLSEQVSVALLVVGVGEITAWTLLSNLSEIEHLSRNKIVALAGIAPFNSDSGKTNKKRRIQEGRAKVRRCLYMATRTAAIHNPVIKEYVEGLRARGKPYKCAIVAGMRKLLIYIQSLLKKHQISLAS